MAYYFITFGNEPWHKSVHQLCAEARELGVFDGVKGYTEVDLSEEDRDYARSNPRGYGFWRWKSAICLAHLETMKEGDVALYADAGCVFNPPARARLLEYAAMARDHGVVAFQMTRPGFSYVEKVWTKREVLQRFGCDTRLDILDSGQIEATAFIFAKTHHAKFIFTKWYDIPRRTPSAIDDSISLAQRPEFRENRHDQSLFSLLLKLYGAKILGWETWCWDANVLGYIHNPIWEKRRKL